MGASAAQTRAAIKRHFAGREDGIDRAFRASPPFRALCRDYLDCVATLEYWRASASDQAEHRVHEYSELSAELTREIEVELGRHQR